MFVKLANICDLVLIMGNHDLSDYGKPETNLLAVVGDLDTSHNIYFLNKNIAYEYYNLLFLVTTQDASTLTTYDEKTDLIKIGLYHGCLKNDFFKRENLTNNFTFTVSDFGKRYMYALLGDQHERKIYKYDNGIEERKCVVHAGSLWQNNKAESYNKGYAILYIPEDKIYFVDVKNDQCVINIKNDDDFKKIPIDYEKIEIYCGKDVTKGKIDKIKKKMENEGVDLKINIDKSLNKNYIRLPVIVDDKEIDYKDLTELQMKKFIYECVTEDDSCTDEQTDMLWGIICEEVSENYEDVEEEKNIRIYSLEVNNYGSFGNKNNKIIFENTEGNIISFSGENANGKSSIGHSIVWCLYGVNFFETPLEDYKNIIQSSKKIGDVNAYDLINCNNDKMHVTIIFNVDSDVYEITRYASRCIGEKTNNSCELKKNGKIEFKKNKVGGAKIIDNFIVSIFGTVNDFVMRTMYMRENYSINFSTLSSLKKLEYLNSVFGLSILNNISNSIAFKKKSIGPRENVSEKKKFYKYGISKKDGYVDIQRKCVKLLKDKINNFKNNMKIEDELNIKIKDMENKITELSTKLKLNGDVGVVDCKNNINNDEKCVKNEKNKMEHENKEFMKKLKVGQDELKNIDINNLKKEKLCIIKKIDDINDKIPCIEIKYTKDEYIKMKNERDAICEYICKKKNMLKKNKEILMKNNKIIKKYSDYGEYDANIKNKLKKVLNKIVNEIECECIDDVKEIFNKEIKLCDEYCKADVKQIHDKILKIDGENDIALERLDDKNIELEKINKLLEGEDELEEVIKYKKKISDEKKKLQNIEVEIEKYTEVNEKNNALELKIEKNKTVIHELEKKMNKIEMVKDLLKSRSESIKLCSEINEELNENNKKLNEYKKKYISKKKENVFANNEIIELNTQLNGLNNLIDLNDIHREKIKLYTKIETTISKKNGIYDILLKKTAIPKIESMVNMLLKIFNMYEIKIHLEKKGLFISKKDDSIKIKKFSSAEKNLFNLIFRVVLSSISKKSQTQYFIDEIFDNLDEKAKEHIGELLNEMKKYFSWIVIVSHDDRIKNLGDIRYIIKKKNGVSEFIK
jgi:DNA repair exonuclease SbcCD ATPase subunit